MLDLEFITHSPEETIALAEKIGNKLCGGDIIAFNGTLAAGKTTFTKGLAVALDIDETITSPTFTIISEYEGKMPLYHIDAYRLTSGEDFYNLGIDDILYGNGLTVIEWSEIVESELPKDVIKIDIEIIENTKRKISIKNWKYGNIE